jgi:CRP/FNR family transcriptional regulator, cyclic AMP receptor protein
LPTNLTKSFEPLVKEGLIRKFPAGSTILYQGEVPRSAYIIQSGVVKSFNISGEGSEQIINFHVAGEVFPLGWLWNKTNVSIYFFEAMADTTLLLVSKDKLQSYVANNPKIMSDMLDYTVGNYTAAMLHICALEQAKASQKILYTLYYLCGRFGKENANKSTDISLQLTHQDIASLVGLTRETTATELNKLKKDGILTYRNKQYQVKVPNLLEAMGEDSFKTMKF